MLWKHTEWDAGVAWEVWGDVTVSVKMLQQTGYNYSLFLSREADERAPVQQRELRPYLVGVSKMNTAEYYVGGVRYTVFNTSDSTLSVIILLEYESGGFEILAFVVLPFQLCCVMLSVGPLFDDSKMVNTSLARTVVVVQYEGE